MRQKISQEMVSTTYTTAKRKKQELFEEVSPNKSRTCSGISKEISKGETQRIQGISFKVEEKQWRTN